MARILHVEDEPVWRDLVRDALLDHDLDSAGSVNEALQYLSEAEDAYDLALVDLNLEGGGDGLGGEVLDLLRARHPKTRLVVVSGRLPAGPLRNFLERYGAKEVLIKGGNLAIPELRRVVEDTIGDGQTVRTPVGSDLFADLGKLIFDDYGSRDIQVAVLDQVMAELRRQVPEPGGAQILFCRGRDAMEIVFSTNPSDVGLVIGMAGTICGRAAREQRTVVVYDVNADPHYQRMLGPDIQSEVAVPVMVGNNVVIGVLNVESNRPNAFAGFYESVLGVFADKVATLLAFTRLRSDLTEALELRNANDLLVAVGDQTSNMVHRVNNLVGAIRFRIKDLQSLQSAGDLDGEELLRSLDTLLGLADRTLEIPAQLTRSLLSHGDGLININECVHAALRDIDIPPKVVVTLELAEDVPPLPLYSFDIVVENLVRNALDAMPEGGCLTISTSVVRHPGVAQGYVQMVVADTGSGISTEIMPNLFKLNFTTKREKGKGLGLGLWWVRSFIRRSRGEITVNSTEGVGTEISVKVPVDGRP